MGAWKEVHSDILIVIPDPSSQSSIQQENLSLIGENPSFIRESLSVREIFIKRTYH